MEGGKSFPRNSFSAWCREREREKAKSFFLPHFPFFVRGEITLELTGVWKGKRGGGEKRRVFLIRRGQESEGPGVVEGGGGGGSGEGNADP